MAKFIFVVQGEGRGHLTQAISLQTILHDAGHQLVAVLVGKSHRKIPTFFEEQIKAPIHYFESPNFVKDKDNRKILIGATIRYNTLKLKTFIKSLKELHGWYKQYQPDVIINFYDFLGGFHNIFYKKIAPMAVVGHQYFLEHSQFEFPKGHGMDKFLLAQNTKITAWGAKLKLALSFAPYLQNEGKIKVVPPLLRKEVLKLEPEKQDFILAYVNSDGYGQDIVDWHKKNPETKIECFWDRKDASEEEKFDETLTFHQISDVKFLEKMRTCKAFVSTAGFESVCEAMCLEKPTMMMPIEGQFEQMCNALDGERAGAGIASNDFNITKLLDYMKNHQPKGNPREWVMKAPSMFIEELEKLLKK
ncbi:MAG: glycosyltransferase [Raineya sp.]|nr:glycosyltransferase [Raineya sp.]